MRAVDAVGPTPGDKLGLCLEVGGVEPEELGKAHAVLRDLVCCGHASIVPRRCDTEIKTFITVIGVLWAGPDSETVGQVGRRPDRGRQLEWSHELIHKRPAGPAATGPVRRVHQ